MMKKSLLCLLAVVLIAGCAPQKEIVKEKEIVEVEKKVYVEKECNCIKYEIPPDWKDEVKKLEKINKFAPYYMGKKIFIDPGHGGSDRRGKSQDGSIVEADVNLRVALYLRDYLKAAGAIVIMSREADSTVDLKYRSVLANNSKADFFISIHHNAPGSSSEYWTNFTSTFYHAKEDDYEYEACERDMAKFVQRDLAYVMGNPNGLGSFDGTYSDYNIYPKEGFSVLRRTEIPSILIECSFFTNPSEQQRLNIEEFNDIQAWGIFRGFGRYLSQGIPTITFVEADSKLSNGELNFNYSVTDDNGIDKKSIEVYLDQKEIDFNFSPAKGILKINRDKIKKGDHEIKIVAANKNGNHSLPFIQKFVYK